jgi:hypothetical protein
MVATKLLLSGAMALLLTVPVAGEPTTRPTTRPATRPARPVKPREAETPGMTRREAKELKWKRKAETGQRREEQTQAHIADLQKSGQIKPSTRPAVANPQQFAEDFDWRVSWDEKDNRGVNRGVDFGYASSNHLAAARCAPGEIGGSVGGGGTAWFADTVSAGSALLDVNIPLSASGWTNFTATGGAANFGWFNSTTDAAADTVPHTFLGWRQDGAALRAAVGVTGASFVDGKPIPISTDKPFHWTLSFDPTAGDNHCGQLTLSIGDSSSTISLTKEQRDALSRSKFDRFGIVASKGSAQPSSLWLDDLIYTKVGGLPAPHPQALVHTRTEFFDTDPSGKTWFGVNNLPTDQPVLVTQNYGYQPASTGIGHTPGCIGGSFMQGIGTSFYGYDYGEKTLHLTDKLRSEGYVQLPTREGFRMGWTTKKALSWREPSTLGLRFGFNQGIITVWVDFNTKTGEGKGGGTWEPVASLKPGPEWHHYILEYDPAGTGTVTAQFDGKTATYPLKYGIKELGADMDLFGVWNPKIPAFGQSTKAYLDDVVNTVNGQRCPSSSNFDTPPQGWVGVNNVFFNKKDYIIRSFHNFGWVKGLPHLDGSNPDDSPMYVIRDDGQRYCAGGAIWLANWELAKARACYGADLGGMLNARDHHVVVTGRIKLDWANVDAGELFGWYNSATATDSEGAGKGHTMPNHFLGVKIDGGAAYHTMPCYRSPTLPEEQASSADKFIPEPLKAEHPPQPPRLYHDGQWREFYLEYDPDGAGGKGQIKVQIGSDGVPYAYDLLAGAKSDKFTFDRFGLLTERKGGGKLHGIYFDKLTYTVAR